MTTPPAPSVPAPAGARTLRALVQACHPGPVLAVTSAVTLVALGLGRGAGGSLLVMLAVLTGQLSVGWANDAYDGDRDVQVGRWDKPVVRGDVTVRTLWRAAGLAVLVCVPLSFLAAGPVGGAAHLAAVAVAWAYDVRLKATAWSWLPYAVSFGLLAPFLSYGLDPPRPPQVWFVVVLALLGVGAHLANGIPDIHDDRRVGAEGLVSHLGARTSSMLAAATVVLATVLLVLHLGLTTAAAAGVLTLLVAVTVIAAVREDGRRLFVVILVLAVTDAVLLCLAGSAALTR